MADESRLRVGGWVRARGDVPGQGVPGDPLERAAFDPENPDYPYEEVDGPTAAIDPTTTDPGSDGYRGHRRMDDERVTMRRLFAIAIMVGALLIGVGLIGRSLAPDPVTLPNPPVTPEGSDEPVDPTGGIARLGPAPTGSPTASPAPEPPPTPPDDGGPTDGPGPMPPTPTTPPTTPPIASYEAESASLGGHTKLVSLDAASGGEVVEFTSGSPRASLEHSGVAVGGSGQYRLTIHYFGAQDRRVEVAINGGPVATVSLPSPADPKTPATVTLSVELAGGANTVRISNGDGPGVRIDRITIAE
jgi:hypothetical protein